LTRRIEHENRAMSDQILAGKRAIVSGASAGMGAAIARRFAAAGADIWAAGGGNAEGLLETIDSCAASGVRASGKGYDFSDPKRAASAVREGAEFLGGLDILVNVASGRNFKTLAEVSDDEIEFMFDLNAKSFFYASREAARIMTPRGSGQILMMGSVSGERARASRTLYCATKAAVHSLTQSLALELGPLGIRVNCLAPGLIDSGRVKTMLSDDPEQAQKRIAGIPVGHLGDPEKIAATALFLVSHDNEFMNGSIIATDGGSSAG
jgi:NAD(P)-dependent dehydrogenase (short-subunit alcohol dehydrogenase family)